MEYSTRGSSLHCSHCSQSFPFISVQTSPKRQIPLMVSPNSLVYLGGLDYFMNVNPVLKNQSVFASAIIKLTLCVSGLLYASHKPVCRFFFPEKCTFTLTAWCTDSFCHFYTPHKSLCTLKSYTTHL